ncbi:hypothetical protein DBV15_02845 [Temnothorax longispinosus]|uniref:Uncharacterized protein n=1 Tax=Temnothorax longispinosus TaxID=300112 RepID=A0A4S2L3M1_9HYME|nr:hypothetical protein DBV15_02845 [Temnothorax longispinosus]
MVSVAKAEDPYGFVALVPLFIAPYLHRQAASRCRSKRDRESARGMSYPPDVPRLTPKGSDSAARTDVRAERQRDGAGIALWMKWTTRRCRDRRRRVADVDVDDGSTKKDKGSSGENRVTVARTAGDQPLNTRRSNCHARFMGRQRNHTSTRNLPSLALSLSLPLTHPEREDEETSRVPIVVELVAFAGGTRDDAHANWMRSFLRNTARQFDLSAIK